MRQHGSYFHCSSLRQTLFECVHVWGLMGSSVDATLKYSFLLTFLFCFYFYWAIHLLNGSRGSNTACCLGDWTTLHKDHFIAYSTETFITTLHNKNLITSLTFFFFFNIYMFLLEYWKFLKISSLRFRLLVAVKNTLFFYSFLPGLYIFNRPSSVVCFFTRKPKSQKSTIHWKAKPNADWLLLGARSLQNCVCY